MAPFVRIGLRILGGYMLADPDVLSMLDDPELIGGIVLVLNECWYFAARRFGWAK